MELFINHAKAIQTINPAQTASVYAWAAWLI